MSPAVGSQMVHLGSWGRVGRGGIQLSSKCGPLEAASLSSAQLASLPEDGFRRSVSGPRSGFVNGPNSLVGIFEPLEEEGTLSFLWSKGALWARVAPSCPRNCLLVSDW